MSSNFSLPVMSEKITKGNFPRSSREYKDLILVYGVPAMEVINGVRVSIIAPTKADVDMLGIPKYGATSDGALTAEGLSDFNYDRNIYSAEIAAYKKDNDGLLAFTILSLSAESKITLETKTGSTGFAAAKASKDTFRIWELVVLSHSVGSGRTRQHQMLQFLSLKQSASHEEFLRDFNQLSATVLGHFESPINPGFVSWDLVQRAVYLNGVDSAYFDRQINKAIEDMSMSTCAELQEYFQSSALERGSAAATSFAGQILIGKAVDNLAERSVEKISRPSLGPYKTSEFCQSCWDRGYRSRHSIEACIWRKDRKAKVFSAPVVCQAPVASTAPSSPVVFSSATSSEDADFVARFQSDYAKYRDLLPPGSFSPGGFCASMQDSDMSALIGSVIEELRIWYDNCATVSVAKDLSLLKDVVPLSKPFRIGGLKDGIIVTHSGFFSFLPRRVALAYYSAESSVNLVSLGYLQAAGGSYASKSTNLLEVFGTDGVLLDTAIMASNRLYASTLVSRVSVAGSGSIACSASVPIHVNAEQRARCDRVELLHQGVAAHASDDVLAEALNNGAFAWSNCSPADVRLNRRLRGSCPQCIAGKMHNKSMPPSQTPPADAPGGKIFGDVKVLPVKSTGGNLVSLRTTDEYSGNQDETPCVGGSALQLFDGFVKLINMFKGYGHRVDHIVFDSHQALLPVVAMLKLLHPPVLLTFCDPGQHCQREERIVGASDQRKRAIYAGLPYIMPLHYDIYGDKWVASCSNGLPNSRSRPSTADIIVTGARRTSHYLHPGLSFGSVCMIQQHEDKRVAQAKINERSPKAEPLGELGIMLGYSTEIPGDYDFLLGNGLIRPRKVLYEVNVHPYDGFAGQVWKRNRVYRAELSPAVVFPSRDISSLPIDPALPIEPSQVAVQDLPVNFDTRPVDSFKFLPVVPIAPSVLPLVSPSVSSVSSSALPPLVPPVKVSTVVPQVVEADSIPVVQSQSPARVVRNSPVILSPPLSRPVRGAKLPVGFWKGANVASCQCVPGSNMCKLCDDVSWILVAGKSASKLLKSQSLLIDSSDDVLIDAAIAQNVKESVMSPEAVAAVAAAVDSFDTQMFDELTIDEINMTEDEFAQVSSDEVEDFHCAAFSSVSRRLHSSSLKPVSSVQCKEIPMMQALRCVPKSRIAAVTKTEIDKQQRLGCLGRRFYSKSELPQGCGTVYGHALYKLKADGRETVRIAAMGNRLPKDPSVVNFAAVASDDDKSFVLAMMQAHAEARGDKLNITLFDVVGGFLHIKRTSSVRLFLLLPLNLPHPLAGMYVEIFGALYGLRESNRLFMNELQRVIATAGFSSTVVSPMTFVAFDPDDSGKKCVVSVHVDDGRALDNCPSLTTRLIHVLEARFGSLTKSSSSGSFTGTFAGIEMAQLPNGAILTTQDSYIRRVAGIIGVEHMEPVDIPGENDFFCVSSSAADLVPVDPLKYQSLSGHLVQMLKTRDEIRHLVSHSCSRNSSPDEGDYSKAVHILRYLHSTLGVGRVYKSSSAVVYAHADAAFAVHSNGCSAGAYFLSVGSANAPFHCYARAQSDVATCPMTSEYYSAASSCKAVMFYREFSRALRFAPIAATCLYLDSRTAVNLVVAPEVSKRSRHIAVSFHYIRQLVAEGHIRVQHVLSQYMRADAITKIFPRAKFRRQRAALLNSDGFLRV